MKISVLISGRFVACGSLLALSCLVGGLACSKSYRQVDSSTNWLRSCDSSSECGDLSCLCGVCNAPCSNDDGCGMLDSNAECSTEPMQSGTCASGSPSMNVCVLRCDGDSDCHAGLDCIDGLCTDPGAGASARVDSGSPSPVARSTTGYSQIAVGGRHGCALRNDDNAVECWGSDYYGTVSGAEDVGIDVVQLASGGYHTCALHRDGTLSCWGVGSLDEGQVNLTNRDTRNDFTFVAAGDQHTCALRAGGTAVCWGNDNYDQVGGPNGYRGPDLVHVACGYEHTCAVRDDGTLICWGRNISGEVSGPNADGGTDFTQVAAGAGHTCALRSNGSLICWGTEQWEDEVSGPNADSSTDFVQVTAAAYQTCGLHRDGSALCWGDDSDGQVSGLNAEDTRDYIQLSGSIEVDGNNLCGLHASGVVSCWGSDTLGQVSGVAGLRTQGAGNAAR